VGDSWLLAGANAGKEPHVSRPSAIGLPELTSDAGGIIPVSILGRPSAPAA